MTAQLARLPRFVFIFVLCFQITFASVPFARADQDLTGSQTHDASKGEDSSLFDESQVPLDVAKKNAESFLSAQFNSKNPNSFSDEKRIDTWGLYDTISGRELRAQGISASAPVVMFRGLGNRYAKGRQEAQKKPTPVDLKSIKVEFQNGSGARSESIYGYQADQDYRGLRSQNPEGDVLELSDRGDIFLMTKTRVTSAVLFGQYIVFVEKNRFVAEAPQLPNEVTEPLGASKEKGVQYLSFVDLKTYQPILGEHSPPIFSIPIAANTEAQELEVSQGQLLVKTLDDVTPVPLDVISSFSNMQQVAVDVEANLLNPETYESSGVLVDEMVQYFRESVNQAANSQKEQFQQAVSFTHRIASKLDSYRQGNKPDIAQDSSYQKTVANMQLALKSQRKLSSRIGMIMRRLSVPNPTQAPVKIREAIAMVVQGLRTSNSDREHLLREGTLQLAKNPWVKFGTGVAAAAVVGSLYPQQVSEFGYHILNAGNTAVAWALGTTRNMWDLAGYTAHATFEGWSWSAFKKAYLAGENRYKFLVGISGLMGTAVAYYAITTWTVKSWMLARDISFQNLPGLRERVSQGANPAKAIMTFCSERVDAFVERQRRLVRAYDESQTRAFARMAEQTGSTANTHFTTEEEAHVDQLLEDIKKRNQTFFGRWISKLKPEKARFKSQEEVRTFWSALGTFLFSYASETEAFEAFTHFWNGFTIFRRIFFSPTLFYAQLLYPNLINTALGDGSNKNLIFPTKWNGGLLNPWETSVRIAKILTFSQAEDKLRQWEDKIIPVEQKVLAKAMQEGFRELAHYLEKQGKSDEVRDLLRGGVPKEMMDARIADLSLKNKTFYRVFVESVHNNAMRRLLLKVIAKESEGEDPSKLSENEIKSRTLSLLNGLEISDTEINEAVELTVRGGHAREEAEKIAEGTSSGIRAALKKFDVNVRATATSVVDPRNTPTFKRIQVVNQMLKKEDSMPRAVRATLSSLVLAKTISLAITFIGLAGVHQGVLQPILPGPDWFGPDRYFFLSKTVFLNGILFSFFTSLYSNAWIKLQTDAQHSDHFGEVPGDVTADRLRRFIPADSPYREEIAAGFERSMSYLLREKAEITPAGVIAHLGLSIEHDPVEDLRKKAAVDTAVEMAFADAASELERGPVKDLMSYPKWYLKQTFQNPHNSWAGNQWTYTKIIWGNMKPAFVLMLVTNLLALHRFDLDAYLTGYIIAYLSPLIGFNMMLEQGSEFASFHALKDFPAKLRSHPKVQQFLAKDQQQKRFIFAIWEKLVVDYQDLYLGNFVRIAHPVFGNEAFSRILLAGKTPAIWTYLGLESVLKSAEQIPLVGGAIGTITKPVVRGCEALIMHNYPSWDRYGKKQNTPGH